MREHSPVGYRPTWAEVDLNNIAFNLTQIKKLLKQGIKVMVTIKADAYGHGLIPVARKLLVCGVDYLAVASIDEGIALRQAHIQAPILVLGMVLKHDIDPLFTHDFSATVCTADLARAINKRASHFNKRVNVHIKIDTGMGRLGVMHEDAFTLIRKVHTLKNLSIEGIFTHFAFADMDKEFTHYQIDLFNRLIVKLEKSKIHVPLLHAANSIGIVHFTNSHFNMVRPGLIVYGLRPAEHVAIPLKPVLSLKSRVVYHKRFPKGYGISYGHEYVTPRATTVVNLPIGYGDGYPRNLSNKGPVLIRGKRFTVSGRVCMDQVMVDVGNTPVRVGDEVVLIGSQGKACVTVEEVAQLSETIPYEIVCGLGSRIPRVYKE